MALYETFMEPCTLMEKSRVRDGEGGWHVEWSEGGGIWAAIVKDGSANTLIAEAQGVTGSYTVTVPKDVVLGFHDVIRRDNSRKVLRIVGENDGTPEAATFQFNQYRAESWGLTGGD